MSIEDRAPAWLVALHDGGEPEIAEQLRFNLRGMLAGWRQWPRAMDFLDPASPNHAWKALMTRLYRRQMGDALPPAPARILDLACGSGRMLAPLLAEGYAVTGIDATRPSLEAAARHAPEARLIWGDVAAVGTLVAGRFDAILALELLCYVPDPRGVLTQLHALMEPGAPLVLSVEAWPGAFLADPHGLDTVAVQRALTRHELVEPDVRHVRCYTAGDLELLLEGAGFVDIRIAGTHYVLDGPLAALADPDQLDGGPYDEGLLALEESLATDATLAGLPRAWIATARSR